MSPRCGNIARARAMSALGRYGSQELDADAAQLEDVLGRYERAHLYSQMVEPCSQLWLGPQSVLSTHRKKQKWCSHSIVGGQSRLTSHRNVQVPGPQFMSWQQIPALQSASTPQRP